MTCASRSLNEDRPCLNYRKSKSAARASPLAYRHQGDPRGGAGRPPALAHGRADSRSWWISPSTASCRPNTCCWRPTSAPPSCISRDVRRPAELDIGAYPAEARSRGYRADRQRSCAAQRSAVLAPLLWTREPAEARTLLVELGPEPSPMPSCRCQEQTKGAQHRHQAVLMDNHVVVRVNNIYANRALMPPAFIPGGRRATSAPSGWAPW